MVHIRRGIDRSTESHIDRRGHRHRQQGGAGRRTALALAAVCVAVVSVPTSATAYRGPAAAPEAPPPSSGPAAALASAPVSLDQALVVPDRSLRAGADTPDRIPDPGTHPRIGSAGARPDDLGGTGEGTDTGQREDNTAWAFLKTPGAGGRIFLAGFVTLLFSIGGLVTVGIRRRRW